MLGGKIIGSLKKDKVDRLLAPEEMDSAARHRVMRFKEAMDGAILEANRDVCRRQIPAVKRQDLLRMVVRVAELRADYIECGLHLSEQRHPTVAQIEELELRRRAFEELKAAYGATERLIERGYVTVAE